MTKKRQKGVGERERVAPFFSGSDSQLLPLARFKPNDWNPNAMTEREYASLRHGLRTEGWLKSHALLVWGVDDKGETRDLIIDGEHRWEAAIEEGYTDGPVVVLDGIDEARAKELCVELIFRRGHAYDAPLAKVLGSIASAGRKLDPVALAISDKDLARLLKGQQEALSAVVGRDPESGSSEAEVDEEEIEPPKNPVVKVGERWVLGDHLLICANSFEVQGLPKKLRAVITDPPFAIYGSSTGIGADIADDKMVRPFFQRTFRVINEHLVKFGAAYVFCDWRSWAAVWDGAVSARGANKGGCNPKNMLVWDKGGGGLGASYGNGHELVAYFVKLPPASGMKNTGQRGIRTVYKINILRYPRVTGADRVHNASKPPALVAQLIEDSTDKGDLVGDFFVGGGTIFKAAEMTGRRAVGCENEPGWCDVTIERWEQLTGGKAKRVA